MPKDFMNAFSTCDTLSHCFKFLTIYEILSFIRISKTTLHSSNTVLQKIREITIQNNKNTHKFINIITKKCVSIETLKIDEMHHNNLELVHLLSKIKKTVRLIEGLSKGIISNVPGTFPHLRELTIRASLNDLIAIPNKCEHLHQLVLSLVESNSNASELTHCLEHCGDIKKIVIACYVPYPVPLVTSQFTKFRHLKVLGLVGVDIMDIHLRIISRCANLRVFSLGLNDKVTFQGIGYLGTGRAKIEVLGLFQNKIGIRIVDVFMNDKAFPALTRIVLSEEWQDDFNELIGNIRPDLVCSTMDDIQEG